MTAYLLRGFPAVLSDDLLPIWSFTPQYIIVMDTEIERFTPIKSEIELKCLRDSGFYLSRHIKMILVHHSL